MKHADAAIKKTYKFSKTGTGKEIHVKPNLKGNIQKLLNSAMIGQYSLSELPNHV